MRKFITYILLAGCAVGPNYTAPENNISDVWNSDSKISNDTPLVEWWTIFNDELLNKYISKAAEFNNDILTAESNILAARAVKQIAASSFWPHFSADINGTKSYFSKNGPLFASSPSQNALPGTLSPITGLTGFPQTPQIQPLYNALFDATWELDLFGKTRRTVEAAGALIGRAIEMRNDILITVMAEIARNYIELRSLQQKAKLVQENIRLLEQKEQIIQAQFNAGYVSQLNVEQIHAQLATERSQLPDITAQIHRDIYTISILTGDLPEALVEELIIPQPLPSAPDIVAVGVRSDLLRRRPDVRSAERSLAVATAGEGIAVANFFPSINLLGDGGLQSLKLTNLFTLASRTWAFGGDITVPIFEGGRLMGNLKLARAETAATAHTYQQTVLSALEETESALKTYTEDLNTAREKRNTVTSTQNLVSLSSERHTKGLIGFIDLIDTERDLNTSEQSLLDSNTSTLIDLITLYKALGGGWEVKAVQD